MVIKIPTSEGHMHRLSDERATTLVTTTKSPPGLVVGDLVQFEYNEGDVVVARPPRPVFMIRDGIAHLDPEETFLQAQRRWRREEREMKLRGQKNLVLRVDPKLLTGIPRKTFTFQIPPDVAAVSLQYGTAEFRSIAKEDIPGKRWTILDYDPAIEEYNILNIQTRPNTGNNFLTIEPVK